MHQLTYKKNMRVLSGKSTSHFYPTGLKRLHAINIDCIDNVSNFPKVWKLLYIPDGSRDQVYVWSGRHGLSVTAVVLALCGRKLRISGHYSPITIFIKSSYIYRTTSDEKSRVLSGGRHAVKKWMLKQRPPLITSPFI